MPVVCDAFGKVLNVGDRIAWIANPSQWDREIRKGTLLEIITPYSRPQLVVKADDNPYGGWSRNGYKAARKATLVCCRDISGPGLRGTHYMFPRAMML